ncbi:MAG: primase small subunit [Chloroflexi bacterium]|nr:primase small subunit [Chloroflexota bacterium]
MGKAQQTVLEVAGREVVITNPDKVFFPKAGHTKLDLARYYAAVADGALLGVAGRPIVLKRYVNGAEQEPFFQKRAPDHLPEWIETVELRFPSGRTASEIVVRDAAQLLWIVNLGCIDLNPHPVRADDLDHPDELRVDLDPGPGVIWDDVRRVTLLVRDVLEEHGLRGWPKTSGSRGIHINVRIERRWSFDQVRRAALALAREVERRAPEIATSRWWKEERHGVFIDYNQNAKDRTTASAWSVRPTPDARVSMPLEWDEVADCDAAAFTLLTAPARFAKRGDASAGIDDAVGLLDKLLELSAAQEAAGLADAPWPPHYAKGDDEPPRVAPSRRKSASVVQKSSGRRQSTQPLITVANAEHKEEALAGLERWKARHPEAAALLQVDDVLVDAMRGRWTTWTRIRLNLRHVPDAERPAEESPDPDYDPWGGRVEDPLQLVGQARSSRIPARKHISDSREKAEWRSFPRTGVTGLAQPSIAPIGGWWGPMTEAIPPRRRRATRDPSSPVSTRPDWLGDVLDLPALGRVDKCAKPDAARLVHIKLGGGAAIKEVAGHLLPILDYLIRERLALDGNQPSVVGAGRFRDRLVPRLYSSSLASLDE